MSGYSTYIGRRTHDVHNDESTLRALVSAPCCSADKEMKLRNFMLNSVRFNLVSDHVYGLPSKAVAYSWHTGS